MSSSKVLAGCLSAWWIARTLGEVVEAVQVGDSCFEVGVQLCSVQMMGRNLSVWQVHYSLLSINESVVES